MMRRILIMIALLMLAACEGGDDTGGDPFATNSIIQWDRGPDTVVFRTEVVGGDGADSFRARNEIPLCTIYGDNRVVWINDLGDFKTQVLWDQVTDRQIQDFISFLTVSQQVFNYDAGFAVQPPSQLQPVRELITVNVNGRIHQTDSFSNEPWPLDYFETIASFCKQVSSAPVLYEPSGAWLSAQSIPYNSARPLQVWDADAAGLDFAEVAQRTEPLWLTGSNLPILWNIIRNTSSLLIFSDPEGNSFELVLEVPGIHPNAPPAPQ